eukprot:1470027-Rhodomonas_salina.2
MDGYATPKQSKHACKREWEGSIWGMRVSPPCCPGLAGTRVVLPPCVHTPRVTVAPRPSHTEHAHADRPSKAAAGIRGSRT